jgi:D-alanyl-D-alanine dipeptidase
MVLLSDPRIAAVAIHDCGEPLIDVRATGALRLDDRLADGAEAYARLRIGVVDRLVAAQTLLPNGLKFLIVEGYRPLALQARYFDEHVASLQTKSPELPGAELRRMASRYISPPDVAPHVAGAAVDLTLCTVDGAELWMGTEVNDTDTDVCHTECASLAAEERWRREVMGVALSTVGLVNYPSEWWHWSYGDRYWAYLTAAGQARYGPITFGQGA